MKNIQLFLSQTKSGQP